MTEKFDKIRSLLKGTGLPNRLSPAAEHLIDKSPDVTLKQDPKLRYMKKIVKI